MGDNLPARSIATDLQKSLPKLTDALKSAIADNLFPSTLDGEPLPPAWKPPADLPDALIFEAQDAHLSLSNALSLPARDGLKLQWLTQLGVLVAGTMGANDAKVKLKAMAQDLEYPAICFTEDTRRDAAKRFKFFPSYAELASFFDEFLEPQKQRRDRLNALSKIDPFMVAERKRQRAEDHAARVREVEEYESGYRKRIVDASAWRESPEGQALLAAGSRREPRPQDTAWQRATLTPERLEQLMSTDFLKRSER